MLSVSVQPLLVAGSIAVSIFFYIPVLVFVCRQLLEAYLLLS